MNLNVDALVVAAVALVAGAVALRQWVVSRRFGPSRLLGDRPEVRPGEVITATLEGPERLAWAREVRFDLVERHRSGVGQARFTDQVRATAVVPLGAFQVMPGVTRVPVSLPVPADGQPSSRQTGFGLSLVEPFLIGTRVTEHAWEVRAAADVEVRRYRAAFPVAVVSANPPDPAYSPRPIVIPPSDRPEAKVTQQPKISE